MKTIKKAAFRILGMKSYLKLLHCGFQIAYKSGWLRRNHLYKYHYFDRNFIREGDHILDIGANLGYYTTLSSKWTAGRNNSGHVYAIEPVMHFYNTLKWATRKSGNVTLYNYALGSEEKEVMPATPDRFGYLRTGLAHISTPEELKEDAEFTFKASMKKASVLLLDIPRLDFMKCDIEGYEEVVLPEMKPILEKFKPLIQLESSGDHKTKTALFLFELGYDKYGLQGNVLHHHTRMTDKQFGDFIFVHKENSAILHRLGHHYDS